jgi:hypothetical protein
MSWNRKEELDA